MGGKMELRYMGFDHKQNVRTYKFDGVAKGEPTLHFAVTADLGLFLKHRVNIQEGPTLCARKLTKDLGELQNGVHTLTNEDLSDYVGARAAIEARKTEARRHGTRTRAAAAAATPVEA
jgi:hypothetical protein